MDWVRSALSSRRSLQAAGLGVALVVVLVYFRLRVPTFLSSANLMDLMRQSSINTILSVGMTFVIITAGIDLSVGSALCLCAVVVALVLREGAPVVASLVPWASAEAALVILAALAALAGLGVGLASGLVNGACIVFGRLSPFIVTLGTLWTLRGAARWVCGDETVLIRQETFEAISRAEPLGVPAPVILALATVALAHVVLSRSIFGRQVFAVGGNEDAARISGVQVGRTKAAVYTISGGTAALAAMVSAAKLGSGSPTVGVAYELDAIAATVLGGTSLMGGEGSVVGTLIGAVFIQALRKGMSMDNVMDYQQNIAIGAAIVVGALIDRLIRER